MLRAHLLTPPWLKKYTGVLEGIASVEEPLVGWYRAINEDIGVSVVTNDG